MKISFDLDGVLCDLDTSALLTMCSYKDTNPYKKSMEEWYYRDRKPLLDARQFLTEKDEMYIITGRPEYLLETTTKWVKRYYPNAKLYIVGSKGSNIAHFKENKTDWLKVSESKAKFINELKIDIHFDDEPESIETLRKICPNTKIVYYGGRIEL